MANGKASGSRTVGVTSPSADRAEPGSLTAWAAVPLLVALPVADTAIAIVRRLRARRPLFAGDRSHVYDQLVDRGLKTLYAHNSRFAVQVGQTVRGGDVISYAGETGVATGPHVHFEVRINDQPVDPMPYLGG